MYQFMVTTTGSGTSFVSSQAGNANTNAIVSGEITTMSLTTRTNKWASRAVVALQLAAWSAVGIVLLEKGVASLRKNDPLHDDTRAHNASGQQVTSTRTAGSSGESIVRSGDVLSVIPLGTINAINETITTTTTTTKTTPEVGYASASNDDSGTGKLVNFISKGTTEVSVGKNDLLSNGQSPQRGSKIQNVQEAGQQPRGKQINSIAGSTKNGQSSRLMEFKGHESGNNETNNEADGVVESNYGNKTVMNEATPSDSQDYGIDEETWTRSSPVTIKVILENSAEANSERSSTGRSSNNKRLRLAQMNGAGGGGAAAAVAMITVGAVMLVLGPAVIVLRALDERRQERRFLKLSGQEDLPPSYEQATGIIEQAPTYSSLNLDTIT